eukprot:gene11935-biopygen13977
MPADDAGGGGGGGEQFRNSSQVDARDLGKPAFTPRSGPHAARAPGAQIIRMPAERCLGTPLTSFSASGWRKRWRWGTLDVVRQNGTAVARRSQQRGAWIPTHEPCMHSRPVSSPAAAAKASTDSQTWAPPGVASSVQDVHMCSDLFSQRALAEDCFPICALREPTLPASSPRPVRARSFDVYRAACVRSVSSPRPLSFRPGGCKCGDGALILWECTRPRCGVHAHRGECIAVLMGGGPKCRCSGCRCTTGYGGYKGAKK